MTTVRQRAIGDRQVGALGLGTATFSLDDDADDAASSRVIELALDRGVTYLDTAAAYTRAGVDAHSERLIARILRRRTESVMVGTKGGHFRDGAVWPVDGRPAAIREHCIASLRALGVDCLDLYFLHKLDPAVDFADSVGALEELRVEGLVARTGVSNVSVAQVVAALEITPLAAVQNSFSPFEPEQRSVIDLCASRRIAFLAYSPLAGDRRPGPWDVVLPTLSALGRSRGQSIQSLVLAWELRVSEVVIPILGATRAETLIDSLRADGVEVDDEVMSAMAVDLAALSLD